MNYLALLMHLGAVIGTAEDVEKAVSDLIAHKDFEKADWSKVASDLSTFIGDGIFPLSALAVADVQTALDAVNKALA